MAFAKHKLGRTFFLSKGSLGAKAPLIYLHGGPGGTLDWNKPLLRLGKKRKVIIYDQMGSGRSSVTAQKFWNIKTLVRDLDELIKYWGIGEFHLGGGSWGTTLALEYYLHTKGRGIKSLIFQSPFFSAKDWKRDADRLITHLPNRTRKVIEYCHAIDATDSKVYGEAVMAYYERYVLRNRRKLKKMMVDSAKKNPHGGKIYRHMWGPSEFQPTGTLRNYEAASSLRKIEVPTLFVCGQHDEATPQTVRRYSRLVKGAKFKVLGGCSHAVLAENPKLAMQVFENFISGLEKSV